MRLTLPQLQLRASYNLQELLAQAKLATLLDTKANLAGISDTNLTLGEVSGTWEEVWWGQQGWRQSG